MADDATAAFFAKKKKTKKKFKSFNANKIDVSNVTSSTHVDAPQIATTNAPSTSAAQDKSNGDEWTDLSASAKPIAHVQAKVQVSELLDMAALEERNRVEDDVVERMRVAQTKQALKRAKEGMEAEAKRLQDELENKGKKSADGFTKVPVKKSPMFGAGGKWVPPHMRNAGGASLSTRFAGAGVGGKIDVKDEDAFPDLSAANDLLEKQKKELDEQKKMMARKKDGPVWGKGGAGVGVASGRAGGGLNRRVPLALSSKKKQEVKNEDKKEIQETVTPAAVTSKTEVDIQPAIESLSIKTEPTVQPTPVATPDDTSPPAAAAAVSAVEKPVVKKKKKKKKDLSTFKAS